MVNIEEKAVNEAFQGDYLKRIEDAEILKDIIDGSTKEMVIAVTAEWGNGKTWFIKNFQRYLEVAGYRTIYYNAWEFELLKDPLNSIFSSIYEFLRENSSEYRASENKDQLKDAFTTIGKMFIPFATKIIFGKAIDISNMGDLVESFQEGTARLIETNVEALLERKGAFDKFKEVLKKYALTVYKAGEKQKIIVFVDELDRCSPGYLVEFLEIIKHLFKIDNICYLLAVDKEQVAVSLRSNFGNVRDTNAYLRKIIDLQYSIQPTNEDQIYIAVINIVANYFSGKRIARYFDGIAKSIIIKIIHFTGLSIRDIERLLIFLDLIIDNRKIGGLFIENNIALAIFIIIIKMKREDVFFYIFNRKSTKSLYDLMANDFVFSSFVKDTEIRKSVLKDIMVYMCNSDSEFQYSNGMLESGTVPTSIIMDKELSDYYSYNRSYINELFRQLRNLDLSF